MSFDTVIFVCHRIAPWNHYLTHLISICETPNVLVPQYRQYRGYADPHSITLLCSSLDLQSGYASGGTQEAWSSLAFLPCSLRASWRMNSATSSWHVPMGCQRRT